MERAPVGGVCGYLARVQEAVGDGVAVYPVGGAAILGSN